MSHLTYLEAIVVGAFQGISELFPVSSVGHSVLVPALIGGRWAQDLNVSAPESPYLAYIVGLHVATAAALLLYFWRDWVQIIRGLVTSIRYRRVSTPAERLAWLIIVATIPVGIAGLALEHVFRTTLGRPVPAASFLIANGVVLYVGERLRRRSPANDDTAVRAPANDDTVVLAPVTGAAPTAMAAEDVRVSRQSVLGATVIGATQIFAFLPGISRSGITIVTGLVRGLSHQDAARFSFLLSTPVILAAGLLKVPDLFGPLGNGIGGQVAVGSLASFAGAYLAVRYLTGYFETRTLRPFAIYCVLAGVGSLLWLTLR